MIHALLLDGWTIDVAGRTAHRQGTTKHLSPRAIRLLCVLTEANGSTLSRADLLDRVWPNVIVSDESLTQVVSEVRRVLENRAIIATVARGGYRLNVPWSRPSEAVSSASDDLRAGLTLDAYTLCIEAMDVFSRGGEGAHRSFVDLTAEAVAAAPCYAEARALHALALHKQHTQWSEGADLLDRVREEVAATLALEPKNALAHLIAASLHANDGQADLATRAIEAALAGAPSDAFIHMNAGVILLSIRNQRAAAALVGRAAQLAPDLLGPDVLASRIVSASERARSRRLAERALRKVKDELSIDPYSNRALFSLGPLLAHLGDTNAARQVLESTPRQDGPVEYFRALGFAQIGDVSSALERLDFLGQKGWRQAFMLRIDDGFRSLFDDRRFQKLHGELIAA